jgi:hypothetical protein
MIQFENGTTALQSSNTFVNIPGGFHELIVENKDGCGLVKEVLQYQAAAFFTPNGDGANDYWNLKGLNGSIYKNAKIFISIDTESCSNN